MGKRALEMAGPFWQSQKKSLAARHALEDNDEAWRLATNADAKLRNPVRALELAKKAVELAPEQAMFWNTLGVAEYRAGEWQRAIDAFQKSMQLRGGGDASDWFFLSMAHFRLGAHDEAHNWYDRAVAWSEKNGRGNEELRRFREEADALIRSADKPASDAKPRDTESKAPPQAAKNRT